jgi:hypothetical protein
MGKIFVSKVSLYHSPILPNFLRGPFRNSCAEIENGNPFTDAHHDFHVVLDQPDG